MLTDSRTRNEVPWWAASASGFLLSVLAIGLHTAWPEKLSEHLTMDIMLVGAGVGIVKTVKDSAGRMRREHRARKAAIETAEYEAVKDEHAEQVAVAEVKAKREKRKKKLSVRK